MSSDLLELAMDLNGFCSGRGWQYCITGGVAVQHWGEQRLTMDVDLTVFTGRGGEAVVTDALLEQYEARIPDAREFALKHRVVLIQGESGMGGDVALGSITFEKVSVERARDIEVVKGKKLHLCTPEDLIISMAFADRSVDWSDIRGIIRRQGTRALDWQHVFLHLTPLAELKQELEIVERLQKMARG